LITVNKTLPTVLPLPVDGVVVDSQVLSAAQKTLTDRAEQEAARAKAAADARAAAEAAVKEKAAADQKQAQDEADAQAKAKVAAQVSAAKSAAAAEQARADDAKKRAAEADQAAAAKRAQDAQRAEDAKRAEQQKREAEAKADDAKKAADQRAKSEREAELKRQLAEEERVSAVQSGPLRDQYIAQLQNRIQRAWIRPPSARVGLDCLVQVTQVAGGEVTSAQVTQCNGDTAARQSIENAVYRASPLPSPPDPALFMKTFSFRFHPDQ
jgi:colicin import membrane protein